MSDTRVTFAHVVATPRRDSWSQAYNAGKLFAVLSLKQTGEGQEPHALALLGKDVINTLEEEYFTLEVKNLTTVKEALAATIRKVPEDIHITVSMGVVMDNVLYVLSVNGGVTVMKRNDHIGAIMTSKHFGETNETKDATTVHAASGILKNGDIVVFETQPFVKHIPFDDLAREIDQSSPAEIAEKLSPHIHETEDGGATAIILLYHDPEPDPLAAPIEEPVRNDEQTEERAPLTSYAEEPLPQPSKRFSLSRFSKYFSFVKFSFPQRTIKIATHRQKLFLSIASILFILLAVSIFFAMKKQNDAKIQTAFQDVYPKAQKKYDEAEALVSLNQSLAHDDFKEAEKLIKDKESIFPKDSTEAKQLAALLAKIEEKLGGAETASQTPTSEASNTDAPLLGALSKQKDTAYGVSDGNIVYLATNKSIMRVEGEKTSEQIKNNNLWKSIGGIGIFGTNLYVLDKDSDAIFKFGNASGANKANYLPDGVSVNLSDATDMGIDASIYILFKDGSIKKYTRGKEDSFAINGLTTPFNNPTRIVVNENTDNIYILDNGNSRIVVLGKDGAFKEQYQAAMFKNAKAIDIDEKNKKAFALVQGKIFEISLH